MASLGYRSTALEVVEGHDLSGKCAVVTGGYSGIGFETVRALARAGASVVIAGRDLSRGRDAASRLNEPFHDHRVQAAPLDLSSLESVREFAHGFMAGRATLEILINNAAVMACPFEKTAAGFERQFGTNHIGHFALLTELLPALRRAEGARVVCVSSTGHFRSEVVFDDIHFERRPYDPWLAYAQSKTANALTAVATQLRYASEGIEAFAVHPGAIMTSLQRHMSREELVSRGWVDKSGKVNELFKTVEQGASTSVWAATADELTGRGGRYLADCSEAVVHQERPEVYDGVMAYAVDPGLADKLWTLSETMIDSRRNHT